VEAELFHAGGRTDKHDKGNSRFSQVCQGVYKTKQKNKKKQKKGKANTRTLFYTTISTGLHSAQQSHAFKLAVS
jgi:hypothetical protein